MRSTRMSTSLATIFPLRERPEHCVFFASAFEREWPSWYGPGGPGDARADLLSFANAAGKLPVGVVALGPDEAPLGVAALKATSVPGPADRFPWATAGYVVPALRRRGLGALLLAALRAEARRLGHPTVYCATATAGSLLIRQGWDLVDTVLHDGRPLQVFRSPRLGEDR